MRVVQLNTPKCEVRKKWKESKRKCCCWCREERITNSLNFGFFRRSFRMNWKMKKKKKERMNEEMKSRFERKDFYC